MSKDMSSQCAKDKAKTDAMGFLEAYDYFENKSKRYTQHKCDKCGLYHIWKRKEQTHE